MTRCDQCGFVYEEVAPGEVSNRLRAMWTRYRHALSGVASEVLAKRPEREVWSAMEYACHVRDVLLVQRDRTVLALVEDRPSFARMYRDERVALCRYGRHPMEQVLSQLAMASELCAVVFELAFKPRRRDQAAFLIGG